LFSCYNHYSGYYTYFFIISRCGRGRLCCLRCHRHRHRHRLRLRLRCRLRRRRRRRNTNLESRYLETDSPISIAQDETAPLSVSR